MENPDSNGTSKKPKKTHLGGGKRSRRNHCKKAIQERWKLKKVDEVSSHGVIEHTVTFDGDAAEYFQNSDPQTGQNNQQNEEQIEQCTARRKINTLRDFIETAGDINNDKERCFMEIGCLKSLMSVVYCECGGSLHVDFGDKMGYSREIRIVCQDCTFAKQQFSCSRAGGSTDVTTGFDVNSSIIMCFNELGCGESALRKFSAVMCIPGFAHNTYRRLSKKVGAAHEEVTGNVLTAAVAAVRRAHEDFEMKNGDNVFDNDTDTENENDETENGDNVYDIETDIDNEETENGDDTDDDLNENSVHVSSDSFGDSVDTIVDGDNARSSHSTSSDDENVRGVVDVTVSFDGTWHKRGFTSNYGVGIVIDIITGLVLDYEVLSKYCQGCAQNQQRNMGELERLEWERSHRPDCLKNYEGSSKGMEREAALRLWGRSIEKNNMRYVAMLSDGDSVAYKAVSDANFYPVKKLECINHVDKRMGTALRKKAKEGKLGGRRHGALTVKTCNVLQSYYRNAIVNNLHSPEKMKDSIWASFLHCMSTDERPQHEKCPQGPESWCFYNRTIASGQPPPSHRHNIGTPLAHDVAEAIKPIYERMSHDNLLQRIQHGKTQNANECINGRIWARCPKTVFVGSRRVNTAVASAVSHFNQGCSHLSQVLTHLGVSTAKTLPDFQRIQDTKRCIAVMYFLWLRQKGCENPEARPENLKSIRQRD